MADAETIIEAARAALVEAGGVGASIAGRIGGETFATGVGWRDPAHTARYDTDASSCIYSLTKPLIAALVLRRQQLDLDASAQQYLAAPLDPAITLRHILTHSSGLSDYRDLPAYHRAVRDTPGAPWSDAEFLAHTLHARPPRFAPGAGFAYSNIGYLLLRRMLEREAPLADLLAREFFAPLGLTQARLATELSHCATLPPGWSRALGDGREQDISQHYHPGWVSHRTVIATASETRELLDAILDARVITQGARDSMIASAIIVPGVFPPFIAPSYGLGLMIDRTGPFGASFGHGGGGPGYSACAMRFPALDATFVALTNADAKDFGLALVFAMAKAQAH